MDDFVMGIDAVGAEIDDFAMEEVMGDVTIPSVNAVYSTDTVTVLAAQTALGKKGYNPGPLDGIMGPQTAAAIKKLQADLGVAQTGVLDYYVVSALGITASSATFSSPTARPVASSSPSSGYTSLAPKPASPGATLQSSPSFLAREVGSSGIKYWQAGAIGVAGVGILSGILVAIFKRK